jgi:hypothetical protein
MQYLVKDEQGNLSVVGAVGFVPRNMVATVPDSIAPEDYPFLKYNTVVGEFEEETIELYIDEEMKAQASAEQAEAEAAAQLRSIVTNAMAFGSKLMGDFIVENVQMGITQDQKSEAVLDAMAPVEAALRTGTLYVALERLKAIPEELKDDKYITDERLLVFVNRLEEYLGVELSLSL